MWSSSSSNTCCSAFILTDIPLLEAACVWLSIPSLAFTSHSLWGTAPSSVISTDPSLHKPRYCFLAMLVISDLGLSLLPVMSIFWVNYRKTSLDAYFVQGYFIHSFSFLGSSLLLAIAFDHRVGICYPLRYSSILTIARISRVGLAALCRCLLGVLSSIFVLRRLSCRSHVCSHAYCLRQDLIKLVLFNMGIAVVILKIVLDPLLIVSSHIMICKKILSIASQRDPIIYSIKTKQIRQGHQGLHVKKEFLHHST
uniref:Olfactory receptor family 51 subfamily Q member 1 n=1 Tax=Anas zonorhyncha TaxID=75864 RepID=A0A8B9V788_9AVES